MYRNHTALCVLQLLGLCIEHYSPGDHCVHNNITVVKTRPVCDSFTPGWGVVPSLTSQPGNPDQHKPRPLYLSLGLIYKGPLKVLFIYYHTGV